MDIVNALQDTGLNKNEAKVYLALLQVKESMARALAYKTGIHRANVYDALYSLVSKGIVSFSTIEQKKFFKASPPESIIELLKVKQSYIEKILPEMKRISSFKEQTNSIYLSEGDFALKEAISGLLAGNNEILLYGVAEKTKEQLIPFIEDFHKERAKLKIPARHIYTSKDRDWIKKISKFKNTQIRYFSSDSEQNVSRIVSGNKNIIVIYSKPILVITIEHKDVANFYKQEFEVLWSKAKEL